MWGLVISFWTFALALAFIKTILVSICPLAVAWGLCQNQRGRTSSDVWAACVRGPAFCFLAEDFSSLFLHFSVSSLEIPFGKQVYNSYLHKIRNSTWQIALLLFNCTKILFPFWGIKHQRSQCSVGAFGTTKSPLPTYFTFLLRLRLKKTFKKSCISFLNLWSMKRRFPAHSDKLIFNCRHL